MSVCFLKNTQVKMYLWFHYQEEHTLMSVTMIQWTKSNNWKEDLSDSIDETTGATGRYIANIVIGTLEFDNLGNYFLLICDVLKIINYSTISKFFEKALFSLWSSGIQHNNILLFVTDAAPYYGPYILSCSWTTSDIGKNPFFFSKNWWTRRG